MPLFLGKNKILLNEVASTNSHALELIAEKEVPEGTVILTHAQTQGRGQRGNYWESSPGMNFTGSFVLTPRFLMAREQFKLNMVVSVGICNTIQQFLPDKQVKIKWPNDLYIGEKKVGGTLIENTLNGSFLNYSVIGLGLNINQVFFDSDAPNPTSLKLESGKEFSIEECYESLCNNMEALYLQLKSNKLEDLYQSYIENLFRFEEWAAYVVKGNAINGYIIGVDGTGKLQLQLQSGEIKNFDLKEIKFVI